MADTNIAYQIQRIQGNINNAYSALYDKGATMPATNNSALLADTINSITTGGGGYQEVGMYMIDANGVAVPQAGNIDGRFTGITSIANYAMRNAFNGTGLSGDANFCNCLTIGNWGLGAAFENCPNITKVNFCNLSSIGRNSIRSSFYNDQNLEEVNFSSVSTINGDNAMGYAFYNAGKNTANGMSLNFNSLQTTVQGMEYAFRSAKLAKEVNFPSLTNASGMTNAFQYTRGIETLNMPALVEADDMWGCFMGSYNLTNVYMNNVVNVGTGTGLFSAFANCPNLTTVNLESLTRVRYGSPSGISGLVGTFSNCPNLTRLYLPNLTEVGYANSAYMMCWNCPKLTTITIGGGEEAQEEEGYLNFNGAYGNYIGQRCFYLAFSQTGISSAVFNLESADTVIGNFAFNVACSSCPNLTSVSLNVRETNAQSFKQTFQNCQGLSTMDLSISSTSTTANIAGNTFENMVSGCSNLSYVSIQFVGFDDDIPVLRSYALTDAFANSGLSDMQIEVYGKATGVGSPFTRFINGCNNANLSFVSFDTAVSGDIFANMLAGTDGCTIKFNASEQSTIEGWASYTANFGGTNVTVSFE